MCVHLYILMYLWTGWMSFLPCLPDKHCLIFQNSSSVYHFLCGTNLSLLSIPTACFIAPVVLDWPDFRDRVIFILALSTPRSQCTWYISDQSMLAECELLDEWMLPFAAFWSATIKTGILSCISGAEDCLISSICKTIVQGCRCSWHQTGGSYCQLKMQTQDLGLFPTKDLIGADEIGVNGPSKDS